MIEINNLTKKYQGDRGIEEVTINISEGESFGFLGPNGAGKTTTIRILMGFIRQDKGLARIKGLNCWKDADKVKRMVGYLPGEISLIENVTGQEFLDLINGMHEYKTGTAQRINKLKNRLEIDLNQFIKKMSKGTKQKIGIISTFMLDPEIFILDEPTSGLDPLMQQIFIELVNEEKERGRTFLISSHLFPEIIRSCERVGIIRTGKLMAIKRIDDLVKIEERNFEIEVANEEDINIIKNNLVNLPDIATIEEIKGRKINLKVQKKIELILELISNFDIIDFKINEPSLEQLFMQYFID